MIEKKFFYESIALYLRIYCVESMDEKSVFLLIRRIPPDFKISFPPDQEESSWSECNLAVESRICIFFAEKNTLTDFLSSNF